LLVSCFPRARRVNATFKIDKVQPDSRGRRCGRNGARARPAIDPYKDEPGKMAEGPLIRFDYCSKTARVSDCLQRRLMAQSGRSLARHCRCGLIWKNKSKKQQLLPMCLLAGCFAFGAHTCLHGIAGSLYATPVRANGVGWGNGIAKVGSIAGPFIGGVLLPNLSSQGLFLAATSPLVVVVCLAFALRATVSAERSAESPLAA
jgi:hypothetical protein